MDREKKKEQRCFRLFRPNLETASGWAAAAAAAPRPALNYESNDHKNGKVQPPPVCIFRHWEYISNTVESKENCNELKKKKKFQISFHYGPFLSLTLLTLIVVYNFKVK